MIRAHVPAKTLRLFAEGQEKKYIEERRKHKMVENFPGLINKSNYRGSWTRVLVVATMVLEIAMTKHFMAQKSVTIF